MKNIALHDVDPRILLSHYEELIAKARETLGLSQPSVAGVLLLPPGERKTYLMCLAAMKRFESVHESIGIKTPTEMVEHIELVEYLGMNQSRITPAELRTYSLAQLRAMRMGVAVG